MAIITNKKLLFGDYVRLTMADIARASNLGRTNQNKSNSKTNQNTLGGVHAVLAVSKHDSLLLDHSGCVPRLAVYVHRGPGACLSSEFSMQV